MAKKQNDKVRQDKAAVEQPQGDKKQEMTDNEFPGYPHYSSKEDIMDQRSNSTRVDVEVEGLPSFHNATTAHRLSHPMQPQDVDRANGTTSRDDLGIEMGTEADISPEEKKMLEDDMYYPTPDEDRLRQARLDDTDFDGEKLNEESFGAGQAESGADLDINADADSNNREAPAADDEENEYWSLGGEKEDTVEDTA
jgi:hypothetical protein